jgi:hypothetical protein
VEFWRLAEQRILDAVSAGEFDDLPGRGRPLVLDDDRGVPEHLRMAYRVLKNAGFAPPEVALRREIAQLEEMLADTPDERERYRQIKKLNFLIMKLNTMRRSPVTLDTDQHYEEKILEKLGS